MNSDGVDDGVQRVRDGGAGHPDLLRVGAAAGDGRAQLRLHRQTLPPHALPLQHRGLLADHDAHPVHHGLRGTPQVTQSGYLFFILPALAYILLFIIFDMKMLFLVWRSHNLRNMENPQLLRKRLTAFYIQFCTSAIR